MNKSNYWKDKWVDCHLEPANSFAKRAYALIKAKKLKSLLDIGCGDGRDSIYFSDKGLSVTAVDFSESGIKKLRLQSKKINCILEDIRRINFGENMYLKDHIRHFYKKEYMIEKLKIFKIIKVRKTSSVYLEYKSAFIEAIVTK